MNPLEISYYMHVQGVTISITSVDSLHNWVDYALERGATSFVFEKVV